MLKLAATTATFVLIVCNAGRAEESRVPQPYELTSRGVIAEAATQAYRQALESCFAGTPGNVPQGSKFVGCLKQQLRRENETLAGAYSGTIAFLKREPNQLAKLRNAQSAWVKFRDDNCVFARAVAPRSDTDAFFYDCLLRATIDRRVELRSLVGD